MSYGGDSRFLVTPKTTIQPPPQVLVQPQDPSGYGYAHGPSNPKEPSPKIIGQSYDSSNIEQTNQIIQNSNNNILANNGIDNLVNADIQRNNSVIENANSVIRGNNAIDKLANSDIMQKNQLIEQQNQIQEANYGIDLLASGQAKPFSTKDFISAQYSGIKSGLGQGLGKSTDVKLGFGASVPIPASFVSQSAISLGSNLFQGAKQLVAIAPVIGGEYFKLITTGKSDYNIPKGNVTSISSGFVESVINPSAGFSKESQAAYSSNLAKIDTFLGSVRSTAKSQGLTIPHGQTSYSTAGGTVGEIGAIALSAYGLKDVAGIIPLRIVERPVLMQASQNLVFKGLGRDVTSKPTVPQYKGLAIGYGGKGSVELIGQTPGGVAFGKPSFEKVAPSGYRVVVKDSVGQEVSNIGNQYSIFHGTNPKMYSYLAKTGRTVQPNAGEIMDALNILDKSGMKVASRPPAREISAGATSGPVVNKALMAGIISRQNFFNNLRVFSGGRAKEVYGSNISAATLSDRGLDVMNRLFPSQDVDIAKIGKGTPQPANPISNFIENQRPALARTFHKGILKEQGLITDESSGLHGTDIISAQNIKKSGVNLSARQGGTEGFFLGNENTLPEGFALRASERTGNKAVMMKLGLAKGKILSFSKLSRGQKQQVTTKDWVLNQFNLRRLAKSKNMQGATHPYVNRVSAKSTPIMEKIIYDPNVITSAKIIPDYQLTSLQGVKIGTSGKTLGGVKVAEEGKIAEIPSHLEDPQGSSLKRSGRIFGHKIEQKTIKYNVQGLQGKIKGATENFQYQTQIKKIGTLQSKESIAQQGGTTPEQKAIIGEKLFIGEATHSGGKALVRGLEHAYDKADILMQNPKTYFEGVKLKEAADLLKGSQSDFFKINYGQLAKTARQSKQFNVSSGGPSSYSSKISAISVVKSGRSFYSSLVKPNSSKSGLSGNSGKSEKSGIYSGLSGLSGTSGFSGKSGLSGLSGPSGLSSPSGKPSPSGYPGPSGKPGPSGYPGPSGKPSPSGYPGPSGKPGPSGYPGPSGKYVPPSPPGVPGGGGRKYPQFQFGVLSLKRSKKGKLGPTTTYLHEVNNIFASSLSIKRIK